MNLSLRFFGAFEARRGDRPLPRTRTRKETWLLALLALHRGAAVERSQLAGTLWPESTEEQALAYLRSSLYNLRQVLAEDAWRLQSPAPRTVLLQLEGAAVDLVEFDRLSASAETADLERAVQLYRGPFLPGCDEPWALPEREAREQACLGALEMLSDRAAAAGDGRSAAEYARRALALDPLRESALCRLMEALYLSGDRAGAMLAFRQFRLRLAEELRASPSAGVTALYHRIRTDSSPKAGAERAGSADGAAPSSTVRSSADGAAPSSAASGVESVRSVGAARWAASGLIGRERELATVLDLLAPAAASRGRLVSLVGAGGIGKTRLAVTVGESAAARFADGVHFVDLSRLPDGDRLALTVADALGVREEAGRPITDSVAAFIGDKEMLLLLDNCEHLRQPAAWLARALLDRCPRLRILATTRQALSIPGEDVYPVPALSVPPLELARAQPTITELLNYDSVRLFTERAMDASGLFSLTERSARSVIRICQRVDGLPLALELAAARVNALDVDQIADRLDEALSLLTRGDRAAPTRQQTLTALIDWSSDLLTPPEKTLFRRLAVFSGGWSLEAAEAVCEDGIRTHPDANGAAIRGADVLDLLSELIDRSLVVTHNTERGVMRYGFLETIRQYAARALRESDDADRRRDIHLDYFLRRVEEAEIGLEGERQQQWLDDLEADHDNLRAAMARSLELDGEAALRLTGALRLFWDRHGAFGEGRRWCAAALRTAAAAGRSRARARTLNTAGLLAYRQADFAEARRCHEESLSIRRELEDAEGISSSLTNLAIVLHDQGELAHAAECLTEALEIDRRRDSPRDAAIVLTNLSNIEYSLADLDAARRHQEEALATWRQIGDRWRYALSLGNLGSILFEMGEIARAKELQEESLAIRRELADPWNISLALTNLAIIAHVEGDLPTARRLQEESLAIREEIGNRNGVANCLNWLGRIDFDEGDLGSAEARHRQSLALFEELRNRPGVADSLEGLAPIIAARGDLEKAVGLWAAADRIRRETGGPATPSRRSRVEAQMAAVRAALSAEEFEAAWAEGAGSQNEK